MISSQAPSAVDLSCCSGSGRTIQLPDAEKLCARIAGLRIFEDDRGRMNRSLMEINGEILVISQFTLMADCSRGRRPSFVKAASPDRAELLYDHFVETCRGLGIPTATGRFRTTMAVSLTNSGPVTLVLDSREKKKRNIALGRPGHKDGSMLREKENGT